LADSDRLSLILVRERVSGFFEIRISTYDRASGALVREEKAEGVRGVSFSLAADLVKIGSGEVYMISRGPARLRVGAEAGRAFIEASAE